MLTHHYRAWAFFLCAVVSLITSQQYSSDSWVVIVAASRYWFNYRHTASGALVYQTVKNLGVSDDHIILMNALDISNDPRNANPGYIHYDGGYNEESWAFSEFEQDYGEEETSRQTFLNVLTDRIDSHYTDRNRLNSHSNSTVLVYMTGHGGDEFFKFHDSEELSAQDLALALQEMHNQRRYKEVLLILDTCQATTMANYITAPNVITLASSVKGENSYAYPTVDSLGVAIADRFTHSLYSFLSSNMVHARSAVRDTPQLRARLSLQHLHNAFDRQLLYSTPTILRSPHSRHPKDILLRDYFVTSTTPGGEMAQLDRTLSASDAMLNDAEVQRREQIVDFLLSQ